MSTGESTGTSTEVPEVGTIDMKLEVVTLPVSDVDRAKSFYQSLGWRLDADFAVGDDARLVQMTPPHSQCSIHFGKGVPGITAMEDQVKFTMPVHFAYDDASKRRSRNSYAVKIRAPCRKGTSVTPRITIASGSPK